MNDRLRLVLLSALLLFVELALIRWTGSNLVHLSYFSNFVLLGSFLGIGIGFLTVRAGRDVFPLAPVALAAFVVFVLKFPVAIDRPDGGLIFFGHGDETGLPIWITLPIVFAAVAGTMALIAHGVARTFALFEPLEAYRLDIVGSLLGITGFSLVALLELPPLAWGAVAVLLFVVLLGRRTRAVQVVALLVIVAALARESQPAWKSPDELGWSPYYKIHVEPLPDRTYHVAVNGIPHQAIASVKRIRDVTRPEEGGAVYQTPYERIGAQGVGDVLVVGAGTGTDVALALANGARSVDAVEIDPRLARLGRRLHPDRPYDDPRVTVHLDDGRAFLERTQSTYDLILFALPDSLTLVAGQSSLRLESYLFTREAMEEARRHLNDGGVFSMYNFYRERWLVDRLARTLEVAYGHRPCFDPIGQAGTVAVLTVGLGRDDADCAAVWSPNGRFVPEPSRDDYPFLYLRTPHVPGFYLVALGLILAASALGVRVAGGPLGRMRSYADLFFMGAAFLLLETKNVIQFALLFGTTWFVNALVFGGILVTVLAAVEVSRRVRIGRPFVLYGTLLLTLGVAWAVPQHALLALPWWPRLAAAVALAFAPIFVANLIFAERFRGVGSSTVAFGANLLGAMVGGVIEYAALVTGYRNLMIVVAALYSLALLSGWRQLVVAPGQAGARPVGATESR